MGAFDNLDPAFGSAVQSMIAASGGLLRPGSGHRTIEQQIALRRANGCPDVWSSPASSCRVPTAIPGRSEHNHGRAMDLAGPDGQTLRRDRHPEAFAWLQANMGNFGLALTVPGEDWHVELVGGRKGKGQSSDSVGFDVNWMDEPGNPEDELSSRLDQIMSMLVGEAPDASAEGLTAEVAGGVPEPDMAEAELGIDKTIVGGQKAIGNPMAGRTSAPGGTGGQQGGIKGMVRQMAEQMGWGADQWPALEQLVQKESSWNPNAQNPTSTAFGLFQFLDKTWGKYGRKTSDPAAQAQAGLAYIRDRYGDPRNALKFHQRNNWY